MLSLDKYVVTYQLVLHTNVSCYTSYNFKQTTFSVQGSLYYNNNTLSHCFSSQLSWTSGRPSLSESRPHITPLPVKAGLVHWNVQNKINIHI